MNFVLDSDDNSSIQSSPWQRDHCWKQTQPRHNISKEMVLFFHRPERLRLTSECQKVAQAKRRRPLDKNEDIQFIQFIKTEKVEVSDGDSFNEAKIKREEDDKKNGNNEKALVESTNKDTKGKLDKILKKLSDRVTTSINGNGSNGHHAPLPPTTYSLANHIANSINTQPHVSPRKRILRELEKVSLEDTKRSRPKTQTGIMNGNIIPTSSISPQLINGSLKTQHDKAPATPAVSRPISSYSITSLLAHNNNSASASSGSGCNSINDHSNDSSSTSHHRDGTQQQRLSLSHSSPPKSPSMQQKRKSPNTTPPGNHNNHHSPTQSPSPEHHAFHKYRPTSTAQSSSPYSSSYHSPNYMRGSPSPHGDSFNNRLRTSGNFQHSPSHYASSPSHSYATPRDSSLSPNVERSASSRSTPTSSGTSGVRTLPKKTAALRQQFSSPTMESKKPPKSEKSMEVDALLRPAALVAPPVPHPVQMYPTYMYPTMGYIPTAVPPSYYHHAAYYNPAMMAAAAAHYRIPGLHPGAIPGYPGAALSPVSAAQMSAASQQSSYDKNSNGQRNPLISSSPATHPSLSHYVPTSPWNPIPLTNHSINDGNLIAKAKDEPSSGEFIKLFLRAVEFGYNNLVVLDVPLNLSKH